MSEDTNKPEEQSSPESNSSAIDINKAISSRLKQQEAVWEKKFQELTKSFSTPKEPALDEKVQFKELSDKYSKLESESNDLKLYKSKALKTQALTSVLNSNNFSQDPEDLEFLFARLEKNLIQDEKGKIFWKEGEDEISLEEGIKKFAKSNSAKKFMKPDVQPKVLDEVISKSKSKTENLGTLAERIFKARKK